jgi:hypothetical protein
MAPAQQRSAALDERADSGHQCPQWRRVKRARPHRRDAAAVTLMVVLLMLAKDR